jgi:rubrerythrin
METKEDPMQAKGQAFGYPVPERPLTPMPPPSEAEQQSLEHLLHTFETHIDGETETLRSYRHLAATAADPAVALLMDLVVEDEARHHELLGRMATRLRDALEWTHSLDALPTSAVPPGQERAGDAVTLLRHIREEQESAEQLRVLAKQNAKLYGGLFELLLQTMALDSEKHARVLRFICQRMVCKV